MYITIIVERNNKEIEIEVELSFHKGEPMSHKHPGSPDEVEIEEVSEGIELTKEEEKKVIALAFKKVEKDSKGDNYE